MMVLEQIPADMEDALAVAAQCYLLLHQDEDLHDLKPEKWKDLAIKQLRQFNAVDLVLYRIGILEMMQFIQKKNIGMTRFFLKKTVEMIETAIGETSFSSSEKTPATDLKRSGAEKT